MRALVLAAGLGTRLRPLSDVRAKPAIPVAGEPMIRRIVAWLVGHGVAEIVVNLHALPHTVTAVLGDGSDLSAHVRYSWEQPHVLGSAGGPRHALSMLGDDPFLLVNGDTLTDLDIAPLVRAHHDGAALVTLALVANREPHRYGGVRTNAQHAVTGFVPRGAAAEGSGHFVGVQVVSPEVFRSLPDGRPRNSIGDVYDTLLAARPGAIAGYVTEHTAFWDIGTPSDYVRTTAACLRAEHAGGRADQTRAQTAQAGEAGRAGWAGQQGRTAPAGQAGPAGWVDGPDRQVAPEARQVWPHIAIVAGRHVRLAATADVRDSILWDDVTIGDGCRVHRCVVTDRVRVPPHAEYHDAILVAAPDGSPLAFPLEMRP
ncbi:MAG: NDP-sugar synthase [Acidobacteriota bacterium]